MCRRLFQRHGPAAANARSPRRELVQEIPHHTTTVLRPFFWDHPHEPVPEQNFWTLWCKGRLTEADTTTIRLGVTPSGLTSANLHHPPIFLQAGCPSGRPTNGVKALKRIQIREKTLESSPTVSPAPSPYPIPTNLNCKTTDTYIAR